MGFHVGRQLLLSGFLLVLLQVLSQTQARPQDVITGEETEVVVKQEGGDGDDDDSSSEETVEDSEETRRRRREVDSDNLPSARAGIPGLPDPATIIKIAELFQSVGEQVVPILLQAVLPGSEATGDRFARSVNFLENLETAPEGFATEKNE
ncbi:antennal-specific protein OS-C isoform X1 [Drosophila kikkawai]|uniref:Antennal-specific protein OS-C isoform X1 n=1 Tax=Drosophila kikkawai TaxID=30033 RepID=A0A6P4HYD5_DROKI|nr:antennal-specific protein OS-C isoform X1 [Drosophila kikkawai]